MADRTVLRVRGLVCDSGFILLARIRPAMIYFLPGGRLEAGEAIIAGLKRELAEEARAQVLAHSALGIFEQCWSDQGQMIHEINFLFRVSLNISPQAAILITNDPGVELVWHKVAELDQLDFRPKEILEKFNLKNESRADAGCLISLME